MTEAALKDWVTELRCRITKLSMSQKYAETYASSMAAQIGAKLEKPSRMSKLTMEEEEARVKATWQQFDYMLHTAAFGSIEVLKKYIADPAHWMEHRGDIVVGMSDQIPVWIKIGRDKQLYCSEELQNRCSKAALKALEPKPAEELKAIVGTEGSTLTRTTGDSDAEKYRVTYEARHVVLNYFNGGEPVGILWKGALVVKGAVHARLHNISEDGLWVEAEEYEYAGAIIKRDAGKSAGRVLESFRKIRSSSAALFQHFEVYSQPAAVVDSIIQKWMLELQAKEFPCSLWVRDMLAATVADQSLFAMALSQQMGSFIAGGCTPLLQVTDTDFSFSFKCSIAEAQKTERRRQAEIAKLQGKQATFVCGAKEIMQILHAAHEKQLERQKSRPWILRACRNNGFFHWRPSPALGNEVSCICEAVLICCSTFATMQADSVRKALVDNSEQKIKPFCLKMSCL